MQTCPGFFLKSLLESPGNLLEICSVKFLDILQQDYTNKCVTPMGQNNKPQLLAAIITSSWYVFCFIEVCDGMGSLCATTSSAGLFSRRFE